MNDSGESWIFLICALLCAAIFAGVGIFAFRRKDPMHFWSGSTVPSTQIRDIPAYNRANGWLWIGYAAGMALIGLLAFWSVESAGVLIAVYTLAGIPVLIFLYNRIYQKHKK